MNSQVKEIEHKLNNVKNTMSDNINQSLENTIRLTYIEEQTHDLQMSAAEFNRNATLLKNKMWWKNIKTKLICGFLFSSGIVIIVVSIYYSTKNNN